MREHVFEIQQADGTPIGSIMAMGLKRRPSSPGSALDCAWFTQS